MVGTEARNCCDLSSQRAELYAWPSLDVHVFSLPKLYSLIPRMMHGVIFLKLCKGRSCAGRLRDWRHTGVITILAAHYGELYVDRRIIYTRCIKLAALDALAHRN